MNSATSGASASPRDLLAAVDVDAAIDLLQSLVAVPSPTGGEGDVAALLVEYLRGAGFADVSKDANHNVLLRLEGREPGPTRLLLTHLDSGGAGAMVDPYKPAIVDGEEFGKSGKVVRGLGACAPKSAVAAMVGGLRAMQRLGLPERGTVLMAAVTKDMWANHQGIKELLESTPFHADWVVAGEPSGCRIVLGARGINQLKIRLTGKPTHWGRPEQGVNPLFALGDVLRLLEQPDLPSDPTLGRATIAPFEVSSTAAPPQTPEHVEVMVDRRTLPSETTAEVVAQVREMVNGVVAARPGVEASVELLRAMHSFRTDPDGPLVRAIRETAAAVLGEELETTYITFGSNAGYAIAEKGWPGIALGPGSITDIGPSEHVEVEQVARAARLYAALMTYVDFPAVSA